MQVRAELARLGFKSLDEVVGNASLLHQRSNPITKTASLDLSFITTHAGPVESLSSERCRRTAHSNGPVIDDEFLADAELLEAIEEGGSVTREAVVVNTDRCGIWKLLMLLSVLV
jgi:glutamate synthase (ferredoxin)